MDAKLLESAFTEGEKTHGLRPSRVQMDYARQVEEVIACAEANGHGQAMIEAETGVGKTLGYLIPALLHSAVAGKRCIISTYTLQLQRQILDKGGDMEKALAIVESVTGKRLTAAKRIGRRNFVDVDRVQRHYDAALKSQVSPNASDEEKDIFKVDQEAWRSLMSWASQRAAAGEPGEIREFLEHAGLSGLPGGLFPEDICINSESSESAKQGYVSHAAAALSADVVVTNHALLVRTALSGFWILHSPHDSRQIGSLIVDESDRLPDVARDATSDMLPLREFNEALRRFNSSSATGVAGSAIEACDRLIKIMANACPFRDEDEMKRESFQLWESVDSRVQRDMKETMAGLWEATQPVRREIAKRVAAMKKIAKAETGELDLECMEHDGLSVDDDILGYLASMDEIMPTVIPGWVKPGKKGKNSEPAPASEHALVALRWSPMRKYPSFRLFELYPARILKRLWKPWQERAEQSDQEDSIDGSFAPVRASALILTSATLSAPTKSGVPDFTETKIDLGIWDADNSCSHLYGSFSPDTFGEASFVFPDPSTPSPVYMDKDEEGIVSSRLNNDWLDYAARMIGAAHRKGGRVLALTNSYRANRAIAERLIAAGLPVIEKTPGRYTEDCIKDVIQNNSAIYLSPSAWEGLDLKSRGIKNAFRHVVVTQLPYSSPDGAREAAIKRNMIGKGYTEKDAENVCFTNIRSAALRKFKQGFGRGIRDFNDKMTLWVADPRFPSSKLFMEDMTGLVPPCGSRVHKEFSWAIPVRFRSGALGSAFEFSAGMFLADGRLIEINEDTLGLEAA